MNIWQVDVDVEQYMWCSFTETKSLKLLQLSELFYNEDTLSKTLPPNISFHDKDKKAKKFTADVMYGDVCWIVNKSTKQLLKSKYGDLFYFFKTTIDDFPNEEYYMIVPFVFLELSNYLDMENTDIKYIGDKKKHGIFEIRYHVFTKKIIGHHFFMFKYDNGTKRMRRFKYCDDEFKEFIEKNNITGFEFTKIFEFED